jgi:hypothetical protein
MKAPLVVRAGTRTFGLTVNAEGAGELLGLSDDSVRRMCEEGVLPTMSRKGRGSSWRIPTGRLLETLGVPFIIEPAA